MKKILLPLYIFFKIDALIDFYHDRILGIRTAGDYPSPYRLIMRTFKQVPCVGKNVFDIGCGRGRVLFLAKIFGAATCAGLEFEKELLKQAIVNNRRSKHIGIIHYIHGNAALYQGYNIYNYFYLANPFEYVVFKECIKRIFESWVDNPRDFVIVYHHSINSVKGEQGKALLDSMLWLSGRPLMKGCTVYYTVYELKKAAYASFFI